jgi:hypothetical protein
VNERELRQAKAAGATVVAAAGTTAGQEVAYMPRFASDPYPWGHGPDMNDGLRFNATECRIAGGDSRPAVEATP